MWLIKINISDCHKIVLFYSNFVRNILRIIKTANENVNGTKRRR